MELSSPSLLVCLISTAFLLLLLNRSRFTKHKPPAPQAPMNNPVPQKPSDQADSDNMTTKSSLPGPSQPPPSPRPTTHLHEEQYRPTTHSYEEQYQPIHPQLLWIPFLPFPSLHPPPASTCGRKGSAAIPWQEDQPCEEAPGQLDFRRNSDLLSGVGEQFTASVGRRRLSWLVWEDGAVEDGKGSSGCGC
ncbi:hypothetical protein GE09DRAFT_1051261 [Coniochaeta sp. 2T2.1]|nr:hypothetical protein GE09DRAFT_1051261 [Coniochaeta sp. 2T2.1]